MKETLDKKVFIPGDNEIWETVIDFTKIKEGGIEINKLIKVLQSYDIQGIPK